MPYAPKRRCSRVSCPHWQPCPVHLAQAQREAADRWRKADAARPSATARGYGGRWAATRAGYLRSHPACVTCGAPATVVDHVVAHRGDMARFWDRTNWQPLCRACHDRKTRRQTRARRPEWQTRRSATCDAVRWIAEALAARGAITLDDCEQNTLSPREGRWQAAGTTHREGAARVVAPQDTEML